MLLPESMEHQEQQKENEERERERASERERERGGSVMYSHTFAIAGFWYLYQSFWSGSFRWRQHSERLLHVGVPHSFHEISGLPSLLGFL